MKCDVSFSLGSVSTLFRWGGHFCHMCVKCFLLFTTVQKLYKSIKIFHSYDHKCTATFLWFTVYYKTTLADNYKLLLTMLTSPPRQLLSGHFGTKTLLHQDTSALNYSAEVSGHLGTGAEVSQHWAPICNCVWDTSAPLYICIGPIVMHFVLYVAR